MTKNTPYVAVAGPTSPSTPPAADRATQHRRHPTSRSPSRSGTSHTAALRSGRVGDPIGLRQRQRRRLQHPARHTGSSRVGPTGVTSSHDTPGNVTVNIAASVAPAPPGPQLPPAVPVSHRRRHRHRVRRRPRRHTDPPDRPHTSPPSDPTPTPPSAPSPHQPHTSPESPPDSPAATGVHARWRRSPLRRRRRRRRVHPAGSGSGHPAPVVIQRRGHRHLLWNIAYGGPQERPCR